VYGNSLPGSDNHVRSPAQRRFASVGPTFATLKAARYASLLCLFAAACSGGSPTSAPTQAPANTPAVSVAPSPSPVSSPSPSPAPQPTATAEPTQAAPSANTVWVGNTDGEGVYLRRTPTLDDRAQAYPDDTPLTIIGEDVEGDGQQWHHVRAPDGAEGYVPTMYTVDTPP